VGKTKEVQQAIERAKEQVIVQAFVFEQLKSKVNDQAVEQEYKTLKDKFMKEVKDKKEVKVRHILFKDEKNANAALKRLKNGEDFQKLARELSEDKQSGQDGGDLGYVLEGTVPEFDAALKSLKTGGVSKEATKTNFGYHLFKVDDRRNAKPPKFEDVKAQLGARVQQKAFLELVKRLRDKASVEILASTGAKK
ncbi:MAG TPA: peptidylprolyl isomerase, partial [Holosporales bacterium]|nr:peptidylprolyl isomerase [Holosporales bacterium]